jgi:predicted AAA+ superfamily ATPase
MLIREKYLSKIRPFYDDFGIIKVLEGIRRCGKSVILEQIRDELISKGISASRIIFLNLDKRPYRSVKSATKLDKVISKKWPKGEQPVYLFVDEVQNAKGFEPVIESYRLEGNCSIFITGSNSYLLSGKLASKLTGRYVEFNIMPFSYQEAVAYQKQKDPAAGALPIDDYFRYGGFPKRFDYPREEDSDLYTRSVLDEIVKKDLKKRAKVRDKALFERVVQYVCLNTAATFSSKSIAKYLKTEHIKTKANTIARYLRLIQEGKIVSLCHRYDIRGKEALQFYEKSYITDPALKNLFSPGARIDYSSMVETIVYNELLARGYSVQAGVLPNAEIDFVVSKGSKVAYIQVAYLIPERETEEREFSPLLEAKEAFPKYVISMDQVDLSQNGIRHLQLVRDFLLGNGFSL